MKPSLLLKTHLNSKFKNMLGVEAKYRLQQDRQSAERLLKAVCESTLQWISQLCDEARNAAEADAAKRAVRYRFWAALLC
jgi:hypothetical protein